MTIQARLGRAAKGDGKGLDTVPRRWGHCGMVAKIRRYSRGQPHPEPVRFGSKAVELATLTRVDWFNPRRLLGPIGHVAPAEAEAAYYEHHTMLPSAA